MQEKLKLYDACFAAKIFDKWTTGLVWKSEEKWETPH